MNEDNKDKNIDLTEPNHKEKLVATILLVIDLFLIILFFILFFEKNSMGYLIYFHLVIIKVILETVVVVLSSIRKRKIIVILVLSSNIAIAMAGLNRSSYENFMEIGQIIIGISFLLTVFLIVFVRKR